MNAKIIGGILLVVGTSIGGGMLALPVATAESGFIGALFLLLGVWALMTLGALFILEVNLWFPETSNLISMVRNTLGRPAEVIAWFCYLLLLYSLLAAYIAGGSDIFDVILRYIDINLPNWLAALLFVIIWSIFVFMGIRTVDFANRILMIIKFASLGILLFFTLSHIEIKQLIRFHPSYLISATTVVITSFGFATIVPSLRTYFHGDVKTLRRVIIIGSFIPLFCYAAWVAAILGNVPLYGNNSLMTVIHSAHTTAVLTQVIIFVLQNTWVSTFAGAFTSICVITSFLGVSLCLSDFLADGLKKPKKGKNKYFIYLLTFVPPFIIVMLSPGLFIRGLSYAGIFCVVLLTLFPALMAWRGRYHLNLSTGYQVFGGKLILLVTILFSALILFHEFYLLFNTL